jgi:hypothetical protein
MPMAFSAFGWEIIQQVGVAIGCVALVIVYRKLNQIPNDAEDTRDAVKVFGQSALSVIIGLFVFQVIRWIFHFLKG